MHYNYALVLTVAPLFLPSSFSDNYGILSILERAPLTLEGRAELIDFDYIFLLICSKILW